MQHELYLKDPVLIAFVRGWSLVAEGYRLNVALPLHAIQMVSSRSPPCRLFSQHPNWNLSHPQHHNSWHCSSNMGGLQRTVLLPDTCGTILHGAEALKPALHV